MRKVSVSLLGILAISLFASMGMITPASATEPASFFFAPIFDPGSWTTGTIVALELPTLTPFVPLMGASFDAYVYFETVKGKERVCHYKLLITAGNDTLELYFKTTWKKDPYIYTYYSKPQAIGEVEGVFTDGTGALEGFHGNWYGLVTVLATVDPGLGGGQVVPLWVLLGYLPGYYPDLWEQTYHIDPS